MTQLEIEGFLAIVKTGNITAAARSLFVTQPALSRRIEALEKELGYRLIKRSKGVRNIELTQEGTAFVSLAEKWRALWEEAGEIAAMGQKENLNVASVGSVSTYILPPVFRRFVQGHEHCRFNFRNYHSVEAYDYVADGLTDLALISDEMYSKWVDTIPAFKEPMVLVARADANLKSVLHPLDLNAAHEICLPWNPQWEQWHMYWFGHTPGHRISLNQMSLMEYFLEEQETWVIVPISVAMKLCAVRRDLCIHQLKDGPEPRIIYYLIPKGKRKKLVDEFLGILKEELEVLPQVTVFL